jgi:hypothetical protein
MSPIKEAQSWIRAGKREVAGKRSEDDRRGSSLKACIKVITTVTSKGIKISFLG